MWSGSPVPWTPDGQFEVRWRILKDDRTRWTTLRLWPFDVIQNICRIAGIADWLDDRSIIS